MRKDIHPKAYTTGVVCSTCGTVWDVRSSRENLRVDICSNCHPFFTGEQRIVDTAGQVDRFMKRLANSQERQADQQRRKAKAEEPPEKKKSLLKEIYGDEA